MRIKQFWFWRQLFIPGRAVLISLLLAIFVLHCTVLSRLARLWFWICMASVCILMAESVLAPLPYKRSVMCYVILLHSVCCLITALSAVCKYNQCMLLFCVCRLMCLSHRCVFRYLIQILTFYFLMFTVRPKLYQLFTLVIAVVLGDPN